VGFIPKPAMANPFPSESSAKSAVPISIFGMNALIGGTLPTAAGRFRPGQGNARITAADELINQRDRQIPPARKPICAFTLTTASRGNGWRSRSSKLKHGKRTEKSSFAFFISRLVKVLTFGISQSNQRHADGFHQLQPPRRSVEE
jgi:hypothetical protein